MTFGRDTTSKRSSQARVGEAKLADAFATYLVSKRRPGRLPRFAATYREISGTRGVADIIGVVAPRWSRTKLQLSERLTGIPRGPAAAALSSLRYDVPRTERHLTTRAGYSPKVMKAVLGMLVARRVVRRLKGSRYVLSKRFIRPNANIYFFEIKLSKWQRALYQALQARLYASKVYCVLPATKAQVIAKNRDAFRRMGVGVLLMDTQKGNVREVVRARHHQPLRRAQAFDVLLRLTNGAVYPGAEPPRATVLRRGRARTGARTLKSS